MPRKTAGEHEVVSKLGCADALTADARLQRLRDAVVQENTTRASVQAVDRLARETVPEREGVDALDILHQQAGLHALLQRSDDVFG